ncbi:dTDP-glucose 4,6-dehydratase [Vallitalea longa]|uniref:dTDP-glucose 4,6-dehydratase n=1 Tax=Vallitalea longa TaxID=2936439 RepID=A0A9W5YEE9_9FIRM|nr:dTDP-glucose 4,6-dehydratase [Vallitalea longa]GKX30818.1 dTDP-glucose 4,6-dehydratase [Vallitalea longa]
MKTIMVTGGAGFIGSNFIRYMLDKYDDYRIINYDKITYAGNLDNLNDVSDNDNYVFVKGDISDYDTVEEVFSQGIDYVINFAAESHVDRSIRNSDEFIRTNIMGTQVLLDISRKYNIEKYIQISTDEVYGSLGNEGYFTEKTPISPNNPYSASKASADLLVKSYYETYKLPVNITRCSNNYGPYQYPEKLIPLMISRAYDNKSLPVYGTGLNIRDWIHVYDHCSAIDEVLQKGKTGEVYNIGANNERNNLVIVKMILDYLGKDNSSIEYVEDRLGHDKRYAIDANKIKRELDWCPIYDFEKGMKDTIEWYINNENWWRKIIDRNKI